MAQASTRGEPRYRGIFPVAPTTFTETGALDLASQKRCIDFMIDSGVDGLCILANFSEQFLLADDEREVLTRTVLEQDVYTALYGFGAGLPFTDEEGNYKAGYRRKLTFGDVNGGVNYVADETAKLVWGRWNADRTARVHSFGQVTFSDVTEPARLLALTRKALAEAKQPKVSYEIDVAALSGDDADLGDTVAVIDTSRDPEWRLTARIVRRVRTFGETVVARVTVGTAQRADYEQVSALVADVATLQNDVVGIDGNLSTAASVTVVESTVTTAIDDLDELGDLDF